MGDRGAHSADSRNVTAVKATDAPESLRQTLSSGPECKRCVDDGGDVWLEDLGWFFVLCVGALGAGVRGVLGGVVSGRHADGR